MRTEGNTGTGASNWAEAEAMEEEVEEEEKEEEVARKCSNEIRGWPKFPPPFSNPHLFFFMDKPRWNSEFPMFLLLEAEED